MQSMKRGFTLIELLVVIAIIAILAAILFPVFSKAREKGRQVRCTSNERQIAMAILMYSQENDEKLPGTDWTSVIGVPSKVYGCPTAGSNGTTAKPDYFYVAGSLLANRALGDFQNNASDVPMVLDLASPTGTSGLGNSIVNHAASYVDLDNELLAKVAFRHGNGTIVAYLDGHVDYIAMSKRSSLRDQLVNCYGDGDMPIGSKITLTGANVSSNNADGQPLLDYGTGGALDPNMLGTLFDGKYNDDSATTVAFPSVYYRDASGPRVDVSFLITLPSAKLITKVKFTPAYYGAADSWTSYFAAYSSNLELQGATTPTGPWIDLANSGTFSESEDRAGTPHSVNVVNFTKFTYLKLSSRNGAWYGCLGDLEVQGV